MSQEIQNRKNDLVYRIEKEKEVREEKRNGSLEIDQTPLRTVVSSHLLRQEPRKGPAKIEILAGKGILDS